MSSNIATDVALTINVESLIKNYRAGQTHAGDTIAEIVDRTVRRRLRRLVSSDFECDELTQDCVLSVFNRLDEFNPALGTFEAWITGFAQNCWRSHIRNLTRQRRQTVSIDDVSEAQYEISHDVNQRENLSVALESLELLDRELLHMRYSLGMTSDEIATASDMNPPQVRKRISRAVERLRRHPATQSLLMSLSLL